MLVGAGLSLAGARELTLVGARMNLAGAKELTLAWCQLETAAAAAGAPMSRSIAGGEFAPICFPSAGLVRRALDAADG
jgi:hypothetical protein